jgi:hypothetical protein
LNIPTTINYLQIFKNRIKYIVQTQHNNKI